MVIRRHADRPRTRRSGAGRPRRSERIGTGPIDDEILGAAAQLFAKQGVAATTMAQIAEAVGLGVSSIYYYFNNKHALLERIVVDVNRVPLAIAAAAADAFEDAPRRLHVFVRNDAAALCEFPFDINEIHRLAGEDHSTFARYWADRQRLMVDIEDVVSQGIRDGHFIDVDAALTALTILANDEAIQNWYRPVSVNPGAAPDDRSSPADIGCFVADLLLRGLLVDRSQLTAIRFDTHAALTFD